MDGGARRGRRVIDEQHGGQKAPHHERPPQEPPREREGPAEPERARHFRADALAGDDRHQCGQHEEREADREDEGDEPARPPRARLDGAVRDVEGVDQRDHSRGRRPQGAEGAEREQARGRARERLAERPSDERRRLRREHSRDVAEEPLHETGHRQQAEERGEEQERREEGEDEVVGESGGAGGDLVGADAFPETRAELPGQAAASPCPPVVGRGRPVAAGRERFGGQPAREDLREEPHLSRVL